MKSVKIIQIVGREHDHIYGLGEDNKVYFWNTYEQEPIWVLHRG